MDESGGAEWKGAVYAVPYTLGLRGSIAMFLRELLVSSRGKFGVSWDTKDSLVICVLRGSR